MSAKRGKARDMAGITKRGDTFYVRPSIGGEYVYLGTFTNAEDAKAARDAARVAHRKGHTVLTTEARSVTVGEVAAAYLAAHPEWSYNTERQHASQWRALAPVFGHRPVVALSTSEVADWIAAQAAPRGRRADGSYAKPDGLGVGTVRAQLSLLRRVLDRASLDLDLGRNVARMVEIPKRGFKVRPEGAPEEGYTLEPEDVVEVEDAVPERYAVMVALLHGLGLRSSEARGLTMDRVDFTNGPNRGAVRIDRQAVKVAEGETPRGVDMVTNTFGLTERLKGANSYRTVYASEEVLAAILEHVERYGEGPRRLIATSLSGGPLTKDTWEGVMRRVRHVSGVNLTGHDLRHTYGSWAIADGVSLNKVAAHLGQHVSTTLSTYVHPERPKDAALSEGVASRMAAARTRKTRATRHLKAV